MSTAKLFRNGQSQAVRLPREFAMPGTEVFVRHVGRCVLLVPKDDPWGAVEEALGLFSDDFMADRVQPPETARDAL